MNSTEAQWRLLHEYRFILAFTSLTNSKTNLLLFDWKTLHSFIPSQIEKRQVHIITLSLLNKSVRARTLIRCPQDHRTGLAREPLIIKVFKHWDLYFILHLLLSYRPLGRFHFQSFYFTVQIQPFLTSVYRGLAKTWAADGRTSAWRGLSSTASPSTVNCPLSGSILNAETGTISASLTLICEPVDIPIRNCRQRRKLMSWENSTLRRRVGAR